MHEYLFFLFKPSIDSSEFDGNQAVEVTFQILCHSSLRSAFSYHNVIELMLPRTECLHEELIGEVFGFEKVIGIIGLDPSMSNKSSADIVIDSSGTFN